jgi:DNA topoisomerase-1
VYLEGSDSSTDDSDEKLLPLMNELENVNLDKTQANQHFTQPPPRYTEASLIKKMEEVGIGRPSTYARVLNVLKERFYVRLDKKQLIPEERGILVTTFLENFFPQYINYDFTANLENDLDAVSRGERPWKDLLKTFWGGFKETVDSTTNITIQTVLEKLQSDLESHLFPTGQKVCPTCTEGELGLRLGKYGPFLGCSRYPDCNYIKSLSEPTQNAESPDQEAAFPRVLGTDPSLEKDIKVARGPYGFYLQWGDDKKPKRVSLPAGYTPQTITLEEAIRLGALPKDLGPFPGTEDTMVGGIGRFGPYVRLQDKFYSIKDLNLILNDEIDAIVTLIKQKQAAPPRQKRKVAPPQKKSRSKAAPKRTTKVEKPK